MIPRRTLSALAETPFPDKTYTEDQETADFRAVFFGTPAGLRVLSRIFWGLGYFAAGETDEGAVHNEARRSGAVMIQRILDRELKEPTNG